MKKFIYSMFALAISAMTFTSCEDVPAPYALPGNEDPVVIEPTGSGTLEDPYNVAAALDYVNGLAADAESPQDIYIKGKVVSVNTNYNESEPQFGNAVFYISDDGTSAKQFYVYRALYLGNKKYTSGTTLAKGDEVIICGKVVNYKGTTPETVQSKAFLYSLNGVTEGGGGGDTPTAIEVTCAKAVELTSALDDNATSSEVYAVTGYITEVVGSVSRNQQTFWMADTKDGGKVFEAYYANLPEGVTEFKKGSKVKITGNLLKYVNNNTGAMTPEIKNADVVILEEGDGGGSGGGGDVPSGIEINCAKAVELTTALADNATSSEVYAVTGYITEVVGNVSRNQQTFWMADTKDGEKMFQAYYANLPEGVSAFKKGSKVKIVGNLLKYVNSNTGAMTPEIKNADVVILEEGDGGSGGGGDSQGQGTLDGKVLTLVAANLNVENGKEPGTITLVDGSTITFDGGGNTNTPKYYTSGASIRMYPKNQMTITANGKKIASVTLTCTEQSGTLCNASGEVGVAPGTVAFEDKLVKITGVNNASVVVTNNNSSTGAASQLRFATLVIAYE